MIGLIGGLGIGAGIHYYRELAAARAARSELLDLVLVHADQPTLGKYFPTGHRAALARQIAVIFAQLKAAGATIGVIPAVTPHMCVDELTPISPLPFVNIIEVLADALTRRGLRRVALFGSRYVMESDCFGKLPCEVARLRPEEIELVEGIYSRLVRNGFANDDDHPRLTRLAETVRARDRVDAIVFAGTDLTLVFNASNTGFPYVDAAREHIDAIVGRT
jgi:aspartate racemase